MPTRLATLLLCLCIAGCGSNPRPAFEWAPGPARRLVLIGLDGANWEILNPLVEAGRVPLLASLMQAGASAILWSEEPTSTPAIWTTILTGRGREAHGIHGFTGRDPQTGRSVPVTSSMRRVPAIWNYLNASGVRVGIAGAHAIWPAEPVDGFMITRRVSEPGLPYATHPAALAREAGSGDPDRLDSLFVEPGFLPTSPYPLRYQWIKRFWTDDNVAFDLALEALADPAPEFLFLYFHLPDVAQHNFWPVDAEPEADNLADFEAIFRTYEYVDARLAELVVRVGTEDTAFMVVSDHGAQGSGSATLFERHSSRLLEALGYLSFRPGAGERAEIDREKSLMVPGTETGTMVQFWVNRENPELADPERRNEVARRALGALRALRFEGSGRPLFARVGRSAEDPDVLIARIAVRETDLGDSVTIRGRAIPIHEFYAPLRFRGTHNDRGILIAAGPPFRRNHRLVPEDPGRAGEIRPSGALGVRDVSVTVLAAMDLPVPNSMDGRVMQEILEPSFREGRAFEPEPVEIAWEPYRPEGLESDVPDSMVDLLRALGYAR